MKYVALVALCCSITTLCIGQTPGGSSAKSQCRLTLEQSPEIRGVRLGMSADKLMAVFPEEANRIAVDKAVKDSKKAESYGFAVFSLISDNSGANARFSGIGFIGIELLDERIASFRIGYRGPEWKNVDQFITKLSEALHMPTVEYWVLEVGSGKSLTCDGFTVYAQTEGIINVVIVNSTTAPQVVNDRREAVKEKARQAFKP